MQAVVPKAVRAALMMAASISSPYLIAFFVEVLIVFSVIYPQVHTSSMNWHLPDVGAGPVPARLPVRANFSRKWSAKHTDPCGSSGWHGACPYTGRQPFWSLRKLNSEINFNPCFLRAATPRPLRGGAGVGSAYPLPPSLVPPPSLVSSS